MDGWMDRWMVGWMDGCNLVLLTVFYRVKMQLMTIYYAQSFIQVCTTFKMQ